MSFVRSLPWVATSIIHVSKSADWNNVFQVVKVDNEGVLVVAGSEVEAGGQQYMRGAGVDLTGWALTMIVEPEFGYSTPITTFRSRSPQYAADGISIDNAATGVGRFIAAAFRLASLPVGEWRYRLIRSKGVLTVNTARGPFFIHP